MAHGFWTVKKAVNTARQRLLSRRTLLGRAVAEWRAQVIQDLGGEKDLSQLQLDTLDRLLSTKILLDTVDGIIATLPSPVNRRTHTLHPVVRERQQLVETERKLRADLGLERRRPAIRSLREYWLDPQRSPETHATTTTQPTTLTTTSTPTDHA